MFKTVLRVLKNEMIQYTAQISKNFNTNEKNFSPRKIYRKVSKAYKR